MLEGDFLDILDTVQLLYNHLKKSQQGFISHFSMFPAKKGLLQPERCPFGNICHSRTFLYIVIHPRGQQAREFAATQCRVSVFFNMNDDNACLDGKSAISESKNYIHFYIKALFCFPPPPKFLIANFLKTLP